MESPEQKPAAWPPRVPDVGESMFFSLAPPRGQTPPYQRGQAQALITAVAQCPAAARPATQASSTPTYFATQNASQRKLSFRKFDGTELYKGLRS